MVPGNELARAACRNVLDRLRTEASEGGPPLEARVNDSVVHETLRLVRARAGDRSSADRAFERRIAAVLGREGHSAAPALLEVIAERYGAEIAGRFRRGVHRFATNVLPFALTALLNGTSPARALLRTHELTRLSDRLCISGEVERMRRLAERGTLIVAPTHVSNLDSVIVGYALHKLGFPPFAYGAGLNLFESPVLGFFMRNLGAYTVDREKTDPLYKLVLKEYATTSLERGQHGLFFPGGTRSRSGGLERSLKKGLLGTSLTALRRNLVARRAKPSMFIVPCTLTYPLVLEASSLVEGFLARAGESAGFATLREEPDRIDRWLRFARRLLALDLDVHLRFGAPLDPFGCAVDDEGRSLDPRGRPIDASGYLRGGEDGDDLVEDATRDAEYTRHLEAQLLASYRRDTVALDTSVVAFAVFERLRRTADVTSLRHFIGRVGLWTRVERASVVRDVATAMDELRGMAEAGTITLAEDPTRDAPAAVEHALATFATYHDPPVLLAEGGDLLVGDPSLLLYYRNRLDESGLLGARPLLGAWERR